MLDLEAVRSASEAYVIPFAHPGARALHPDACRFLGQLVAALRPARVLEFGSGFSSLVIAGALGRPGGGRLHSIDHSPAWSARARAMAEEVGVGARVDFHVFALGLRRYGGLPCVFYRIPDAFHGGRDPYDLVFVDGPGHEVGRDGALLEAFPRLADGGYVVLDDFNSAHVRRSLALWRARFPGALAVAELPRVGNGLGVIARVGDPGPAPPLGAGPLVREWARTARNLARVGRLGLNRDPRDPRPRP